MSNWKYAEGTIDRSGIVPVLRWLRKRWVPLKDYEALADQLAASRAAYDARCNKYVELKARLAELEEQAEMACVDPADDCDTLTQRARYLRGARRCIRRCRQALHNYTLPGRYHRRPHWQERTHPQLRVAFTQLVRAYWLRGLARGSDEVRAERRREDLERIAARARQLFDGPRAMRPPPGDACECGRPRW